MITHEEAIKALDGLAQFIIMNDTGTDESASAIEWHGIIKKALERAKKVEELLDLYRLQQEFKERYNTQDGVLDRQETLDTLREITEEIYLKEKELEELE